MTTEVPDGLTLVHRGKVRDVYAVDDDHLLMVASDRLSAFDVVMAEAVPDKGRVLTALTAFWVELLAPVAPSHLVSTDVADFPPGARRAAFAGRSMLVRRAEMLPVECIVRGYLSGSAWQEYRRHGTIHGEAAPTGLVEADRLPEPWFTPSTKAASGHDENISFVRAAEILGPDLAAQARTLALALYRAGAEHARSRGIILADTKFEFGVLDGRLVVADEVMTPDSSRFWPAERWVPGGTPPSFDKQPVRDHLERIGWDKVPPPPPLSAEVIAATTARYREAYERITGRDLDAWRGSGRVAP